MDCRPTCFDKKPYATQAHAEAGMRLLLENGKAKDPRRLHVYKCVEYGNHWHVGHVPMRWFQNAMTSAQITPGSIGDGYPRRKC